MPDARLRPFRTLLFGLRLGDIPFGVLAHVCAIPVALLLYGGVCWLWIDAGYELGWMIRASYLAAMLLGLASAVPASVDVMRFAADEGTWPRRAVFVRLERRDVFTALTLVGIVGTFVGFKHAVGPFLGAVGLIVNATRDWGLAPVLDGFIRLEQTVPWVVRPIVILLIASLFWWIFGRLVPFLAVAAIEGRLAPRRALRMGTGSVGRLTLLVGVCVLVKLSVDSIAMSAVANQIGMMGQFGAPAELMRLSAAPYFLVTAYLWIAGCCIVGRVWRQLSLQTGGCAVISSASVS